VSHEPNRDTVTATQEFAPTSDTSIRSTVAVFSVVASATVLMLQCLRVLFPLAYSYRERTGITATLLVLVVVFVAPVVGPSMARTLGARRALVVCAVALACLRLWIQAMDTVPLVLSALASAAALVTFGVTLSVFSAHVTGRLLVSSVVTGLAVDTSVRGAWSTWDVAWQRGVLPVLVAVALSAVLVISAVLAGPHASHPSGRMTRAGSALGPFLFLQVLLFQSVAFVASSGHVALASAVGVVLMGDCLALLVVAVLPSKSRVVGSLVALAVGLVLSAWWLSTAEGFLAIVLVLGGQVLATTLLLDVFITSAPHRRGVTADAFGLGVGSMIFGLLLVLFQIHYDVPLPVSNRWLPALAGALLAGFALTREAATHRDMRLVAGGALGPTIAVGVLAAVMFGGLASTEPGLSTTQSAVRSLRVVTYNVQEAVTRKGQLDPGAMARGLQRLKPDVVVLEEVGRGWTLSSTTDLGEWTKRRLRLHYLWAPGADNQFGNMILSRVPVRSAKVVALPQGSGTMSRSAVIAHVGPVAGKTVTVIGTHLQNGSSPSRRRTRIQELRVLLKNWNHARRTVLAGDLNSDPASAELRTLLEAGFTTTQPERTCTLKTSNEHCVDWILSTPDLVQSHVRTLAFDVSDHRPVVATIAPRTTR
jgi:endonuclease/exonuclease/phosphatase family metal-dependent hydrolase